MRKSTMYAVLLMVFITLVSFCDTKKHKAAATTPKPCNAKKTVQAVADKEWNLSPGYNFLEI
jgi:hypothetical protein